MIGYLVFGNNLFELLRSMLVNLFTSLIVNSVMKS